MEELLHYVWKHKIFPSDTLQTTTGQPVVVIDPGFPNTNEGPDFLNARIKIDDTLWVGHVEIHTRASDWLLHKHDRNPAYDSVILHIVSISNCNVYRSNGEPIPQMLLSCPESVRLHYTELKQTDALPPCSSILPSLPKLTVHSWLSALQIERFDQKAQAIYQRLKNCNQHWEDAFFITLARNFGFGLNGDAFETWASHLPFRAVDKHRDNLLQVEALFFGQAGLLNETPEEGKGEDSYYQQLHKEFRYLRHKFNLPTPISIVQWRFLRIRPDNFPHVRLAQLAWLYHKEESLFSRIMEAETTASIEQILTTGTSAYWEEHFNFRKPSPRRKKRLGRSALNLIIINTVVPFLYAYGRHKANEVLCERATRFLETLKAEDNHVTRLWDGIGLPVDTAADSQALLQLQKEYCDKRDCLHCRFGYEYLKHSS